MNNENNVVDAEKIELIQTLWPIIVTSTPNKESFARKVCSRLENKLGLSYTETGETIFQDSERYFAYKENLREREVYIIGSTEQPDKNFMDLCALIHTAKYSCSASSVTAVIPYFGWARADRKDQRRKSVMSALVVSLLEATQVDRVMILDPHFLQLQSMFMVAHIRCDLLFGTKTIVDFVLNKTGYRVTETSCIDAGGLRSIKHYSKRFDVPYFIALKDRVDKDEIKIIGFDIKDYEFDTVFEGDDLTTTLGGLTATAAGYKKQKADNVIAGITHFVAVDSNTDILLENLEKPVLDALIITDSVEVPDVFRKHPKIQIAPVVDLMADAIYNTYIRKSISQLFVLPKGGGHG